MKTIVPVQKLFVTCFFLTYLLSVEAQQVEIKASQARIMQERQPGFKTRVEADSEDLEKYLRNTLRDFGKMRDRGTYYQITEVNLSGEYYGERSFYAQLTRGEDDQGLWVGVDSTGLGEFAWHQLSTALEKYTYDLVISYYRNEVQEDIDESLKAQDFLLRQQRRLIRDSTGLRSDLEDNELELIRLHEAIEANKAEHEKLLEEIEKTKLEVDSINTAIIRIEAVLESQKKKKESIK